MKKQLVAQKDGQHSCQFFQQDQKGHWRCRLMEFSGQPCAIITPHGRIEWATTSAHKLMQRYWPERTGVNHRLPPLIHRWMILRWKRMGARDKFPTQLAPLIINQPSAHLIVRCLPDGTNAALLFEEILLELPTDHLVSLGLTSRETEVLRWLSQGKSSFEIAAILNISSRTVSKHLERVYLQLGVENRHAAVALVHDELRKTAPR
jgi:DNA-binding CsgD family transcriptional regulator